MFWWQSFKQTLWLTSLLNECTLVFNTWILSPSTTTSSPSHKNRRQLLPHPLVCASLYAICEPLCTLLLRQIPMVPFSIVLAAGMLHLGLGTGLDQTASFIVAYRQGQASASRPNSTALDSKVHPQSENDDPVDKDDAVARGDDGEIMFAIRAVQTIAVAHIFTAAALNAGLCILAQSLEVSIYSIEDSTTTALHWLSTMAYAFFLFSRMADYGVSYHAQRPLYLGHSREGSRITTLMSQLQTLVCLHAIRIMIRKALGMPAFGSLEEIAQQEIERLYGPERYARMERFSMRAPEWLTFGMSFVGPVCTAISIWYWSRAREDARRAGRERVEEAATEP